MQEFLNMSICHEITINEKIKSWNIVRETIVRKFYILANFLPLSIIFGMLGRCFLSRIREEEQGDHIHFGVALTSIPLLVMRFVICSNFRKLEFVDVIIIENTRYVGLFEYVLS